MILEIILMIYFAIGVLLASGAGHVFFNEVDSMDAWDDLEIQMIQRHILYLGMMIATFWLAIAMWVMYEKTRRYFGSAK